MVKNKNDDWGIGRAQAMFVSRFYEMKASSPLLGEKTSLLPQAHKFGYQKPGNSVVKSRVQNLVQYCHIMYGEHNVML